MKKGVMVIFPNGEKEIRYFYGKDEHHDDVLWKILAERQIIPDSYKRLTSHDLSYGHELSSIGREGLIAASNGMIVMFLVYGEEEKREKYTITYLPEKMTDEQNNELLLTIDLIDQDTEHNAYYAGTIPKQLSYEEIDNTNYAPEFYDELSFSNALELKDYIVNKKNVTKK